MTNIYDNVPMLQEQMYGVLSELPYKLSCATTDISDDDLNLLIKNRSAVTATVSIYYVVN